MPPKTPRKGKGKGQGQSPPPTSLFTKNIATAQKQTETYEAQTAKNTTKRDALLAKHGEHEQNVIDFGTTNQVGQAAFANANRASRVAQKNMAKSQRELLKLSQIVPDGVAFDEAFIDRRDASPSASTEPTLTQSMVESRAMWDSLYADLQTNAFKQRIHDLYQSEPEVLGSIAAVSRGVLSIGGIYALFAKTSLPAAAVGLIKYIVITFFSAGQSLANSGLWILTEIAATIASNPAIIAQIATAGIIIRYAPDVIPALTTLGVTYVVFKLCQLFRPEVDQRIGAIQMINRFLNDYELSYELLKLVFNSEYEFNLYKRSFNLGVESMEPDIVAIIETGKSLDDILVIARNVAIVCLSKRVETIRDFPKKALKSSKSLFSKMFKKPQSTREQKLKLTKQQKKQKQKLFEGVLTSAKNPNQSNFDDSQEANPSYSPRLNDPVIPFTTRSISEPEQNHWYGNFTSLPAAIESLQQSEYWGSLLDPELSDNWSRYRSPIGQGNRGGSRKKPSSSSYINLHKSRKHTEKFIKYTKKLNLNANIPKIAKNVTPKRLNAIKNKLYKSFKQELFKK